MKFNEVMKAIGDIGNLDYIYKMSNEDKDKKIADLRTLLGQARTRIEQYKAQLMQKEKQNDQVKKQFQKKIRLLEGDSQNIINQYEERLLRYQKTIQDSEQQINNIRITMQKTNKNYEEYLKKISQISLIVNKIFALPPKEKDSSDAVQQLCQIQKCKQFAENLQMFGEKGQKGDMQILTKMLSLLVKNNQSNLNKRRQQRIQFVKRQNQLQKSIEQQKNRSKASQGEIDALKKQLNDVRNKHQKQIQAISINKQKQQQEKTNEEFVKQLLIKVIIGPKDAAIMAFGILAKVLKFNEDEMKQCQKKLK